MPKETDKAPQRIGGREAVDRALWELGCEATDPEVAEWIRGVVRLGYGGPSYQALVALALGPTKEERRS